MCKLSKTKKTVQVYVACKWQLVTVQGLKCPCISPGNVSPLQMYPSKKVIRLRGSEQREEKDSSLLSFVGYLLLHDKLPQNLTA
jgi:hypothetical protein